MKISKSLETVCEEAIKISSRNPNTIIGVFKRFDTGEYYYSYWSTQIRVADEFVCQYIGGELAEECVQK